MRTDARLEDLLRQLAPQVLGALVRRYGHFDACEDAVQEALQAAATSWPADGLPDQPRAWLTTVASRRLTDALRADSARRRREDRVGTERPPDAELAPEPDRTLAGGTDDTLALLFLCCDPALSATSQMALTLRAVGGLTTAEIAAAFLVPESTIGQRISRAKQTLRDRGLGSASAATGDPGRLAVVLHVLYLVFNEGYSASAGERLERRELAAEAIRLTRMLHRLAPDDPEVAGLLALMLLTDARHGARAAADGSLVALADQDRSLWDRTLVEEGVAVLRAALAVGRVGSYQLQAAIAAVHDEAATVEDTDWHEIAGLYRLLERLAPSPVLTLNRAVAEGHARGPETGLAVLAMVTDDPRVAGSHRVHAVRAHLLELAGDRNRAREEYLEAARRATSLPERTHLHRQAARLASLDDG
jgi:RNA polymerase sigma factor (sigma-70 family)